MSKQNLNNTKQLKSQTPWPLTQPKIKTVSPQVARRIKPNEIRLDAKIQTIKKSDASRSQVEGFIKSIFRKHHGAQLTHFAPSLLATFNQENEVEAALGYRLAKDEPLFLEHYLDQSIESLMSSYLDRTITRESITEISNLASSNPRSCKHLFAHITNSLHQQDIEWIVSTGTAVMRVVHRRLGIRAHIIHDVDASLLGEDKYAWGSFYDDDPKILLINVAQARQSLFKSLQQQNFQ